MQKSNSQSLAPGWLWSLKKTANFPHSPAPIRTLNAGCAAGVSLEV